MNRYKGNGRSDIHRIVILYMKELKIRNPKWSIVELLEELAVGRSPTIVRLAIEAGFRYREQPTSEQICGIAKLIMDGYWSIDILAEKMSVPRDVVLKIMESSVNGYGCTAYGINGYGDSRTFSDGSNAVNRRVTTAGQLSYRGCLYTLGADYRGRKALIKEKGSQLLVMFKDRSPLFLTKRIRKV